MHFLNNPRFTVDTLVSFIPICLLYQCLIKKGLTVLYSGKSGSSVHAWRFSKQGNDGGTSNLSNLRSQHHNLDLFKLTNSNQ